MLFDFLLFKKEDYNFLEIFVIAFFYASLAIFMSYVAFRDYSSLLSVFLTTMAVIPFVISRIKSNEELDLKLKSTKRIFAVHSHTLLLFMFMFLGITLAYMFWYVFVDISIRPVIFNAQANIVSKINGGITSAYSYTKSSLFLMILTNNIKVLSFVAVFALVYGFGGMFILSWNASVLGYALGDYFLRFVHMGFSTALIQSFLRYFTHGILEILAYFISSLGAGIVFIAFLRQDFRKKNFDIIVRDVCELFFLAIVILIIAAYIEVYVTPFFY